jgi:poly-gamma-glutamate capsule biosynthesis protein CapA/YwtB (metallophosphatase superfamily)
MYRIDERRSSGVGRKWLFVSLGVVSAAVIAVLAIALVKHAPSNPITAINSKLQFDDTVTDTEKQAITQAIKDQSKTYSGSVTARVDTVLETQTPTSVVAAYVPVTNVYATRQAITKAELAGMNTYVAANTPDTVRSAVAAALGLDAGKLTTLTTLEDLPDSAVAFVPASELTPKVKLLTFDGTYYLDTFQKGAVLRQVTFNGKGASDLGGLALPAFATKDSTLKVNMTGVTALTRTMMKKLDSTRDPLYFSKQIGAFLADADITHVSNEVSFKTGCQYSTTVFCAPPQMIETLKDSGIDLVELTGNHNNDSGNQYNIESINLYHSLGWHTFGGGLNTTEAAKPYIADQKQSKIAFLGYNYADGPGSGAIASSSTAGANSFDMDKVRSDIATAKQQSNFVVVDVQFWECYAYPEGFTEFPECDLPITNQKEVFRQIADAGADMVIGTQAHQPQTYEIYKGKPIYYGLGNLYFEQTQWPGTERGIILTHYFVGGKLVQTKLSPTVYDKGLQTHLMDNASALKLLERLKTARQTAGL